MISLRAWVCAAVLVPVTAFANPTTTNDALASFLTRERIINQVTQVSGTITDATKGLAGSVGSATQELAGTVSDVTAELLINAMQLIGVPYRWGGNSPDTGLDCSGLVKLVYDQTLGTALPRTSREQAKATKVIQKAELQPGDLVFFNTRKAKFSHVGIYIGDNQFIHAPRKGTEVRIEQMNTAYWNKRYNGARRVEVN